MYVAITSCASTSSSSEPPQDEGDTGGQEEEEVPYVLEEFLVSTVILIDTNSFYCADYYIAPSIETVVFSIMR